MSTYAPIVTLDGQAKIADAIENSATINISHIGVGDGGGSAIIPLETMTALTNEVWRGTVTSAGRDPTDLTRVMFTATIPIEAGPFVIREIAAFTSDGKMFAIGAYPEQTKPTAAQGAVSSVEIEFVVVVAEAASVTLAISPSQLTYLNNLARVPFYGVDAITNDPPADPAPGAMVVIGTNPNGAFFGHANKVAMWNSSLWAVAQVPKGTVVANAADDKYYRFTGSAWVLWQAGQGSLGLVDLSMFERMPFFPEVLSADGKMTLATVVGTVTVNTGFTIRWRGFRDFATSSFALVDRQFTTVSNKTYHLRWHAPGYGDAANAANYPNGRFVLKDLASVTYNPSSRADAHASFDSSYDDVLIARVVTNAGNTATVTTLANKHALTFSGVIVGTNGTNIGANLASYDLVQSLGWARSPTTYSLSPRSVQVTGIQENDWSIGGNAPDRYGLQTAFSYDFAESALYALFNARA